MTMIVMNISGRYYRLIHLKGINLICQMLKRGCSSKISPNVLQISEGTNSVGIVQWDLGFCLCAVSSRFLTNYKFKTNTKWEQSIQKQNLKDLHTDLL
jgi:hypothetical protein